MNSKHRLKSVPPFISSWHMVAQASACDALTHLNRHASACGQTRHQELA
jgi:hypothetical protein